MIVAPMPLSRLRELQRVLDLGAEDLHHLRLHREVFIARKEEFSDLLHAEFLGLAETRIILDHEDRPEFLRRAWIHWFDRLFFGQLDENFMEYLWRIGTRHVEVNLDQRYSNLAFSLARRFCHGVVAKEVPTDHRAALTIALDKMLDFCLLVETTAYIEATTGCDLEVIKGVADRVRTPATVIGGNVRRLQRRNAQDATLRDVYGILMFENQRLERMVEDIESYALIHERKPEFAEFFLEPLLRDVWQGVRGRDKLGGLGFEMEISERGERAIADARDCRMLFSCLLQNSVDAVAGADPVVRVSSRPVPGEVANVEVAVFNSGRPPTAEELEMMAAPFFSTKSFGTGFGLAIARLAVRKNFGKMSIEPVPEEGTLVRVVLPSPAAR